MSITDDTRTNGFPQVTGRPLRSILRPRPVADTPATPPTPPMSSGNVTLPGVPEAVELAALRDHAADVIAVQDSPELRAAKTRAEIDAERELAAEHRANLLELQRERNAAELTLARSALATETQIARAGHADQLESAQVKARLARLSSPVGYIAAQSRARRASLALVALPAVIAVAFGAVQVQSTVAAIMGLSSAAPLWWLLYGLEPLATLPLVAILLYEGSAPGGSPTSWRELARGRFLAAEVGLLVASVLLNAGPHLAQGQVGTALIWLAVPATIVLTLNLLPRLSEAYTARIMGARTEAELGAPTGRLPGDQAKRFRQAAMILAADQAGEIGGFRDADGLPSKSQILKVLKSQQGAASVPDAMAVLDALRLLRGIEPPIAD